MAPDAAYRYGLYNPGGDHPKGDVRQRHDPFLRRARLWCQIAVTAGRRERTVGTRRDGPVGGL